MFPQKREKNRDRMRRLKADQEACDHLYYNPVYGAEIQRCRHCGKFKLGGVS